MVAVRIVNRIVDFGIPEVQCIFQQLIAVDAQGSVGIGNKRIAAIHRLAGNVPCTGDFGIGCLDFIARIVAGCFEHFPHKLRDVLRLYPVCTQPHFDFRSIQVFGLYPFEVIHIDLVLCMVCRKGFSCGELFTNIAGQVFIRGFPLLCHRISENRTCQFIRDLLFRFTAELHHKRHIHLCFFSNGKCQGFAWRIHRGNRLRLTDGTFGKNISQTLEVLLLVQNFQRCQQTITAVLSERPLVGGAVDKTILRLKCGVLLFQFILQKLYFRIRAIMQLTIQQLPGGFAQSDHAQHPLCSYGRQFHLIHKGIFAVVNLPVHVREAEILHAGVCRDRFFLHIQFIVGDFRLRDGGMDVADRLF